MRLIGGQGSAGDPPFQLVLETDLFVGNGEAAVECSQRQAARPARNPSQRTGIAIRQVGDIAAEKLVRAFAGKRHRHVAAAHARKIPDRQRPGVRAGLV